MGDSKVITACVGVLGAVVAIYGLVLMILGIIQSTSPHLDYFGGLAA